MTEPAYVAIAGDYARHIRGGKLTAGTQLPSYTEIAERYEVSDIVVRKAVELLQNQGLVRTVRRRGVFVADRPNLIRISPERQTEDPEVTFRNESDEQIVVDRETEQVGATDEIADALGLSPGDQVTHTITRASEGGRPISISDTYQPINITNTETAAFLEETIRDQLPRSEHANWLRIAPGDLVKSVHQRFLASTDDVIMISDVSYPRDRYDAYVFRMSLPQAQSE